jgi:hypothetical protein
VSLRVNNCDKQERVPFGCIHYTSRPLDDDKVLDWSKTNKQRLSCSGGLFGVNGWLASGQVSRQVRQTRFFSINVLTSQWDKMELATAAAAAAAHDVDGHL